MRFLETIGGGAPEGDGVGFGRSQKIIRNLCLYGSTIRNRVKGNTHISKPQNYPDQSW
jgi:hypothetical protein